MASKSMVRPAGMPSMIVTSALPCDSPAVRNRSIGPSFYPKKLRAPVRVSPFSVRKRQERWQCRARTTGGAAGGDLAQRLCAVMQIVADRFVGTDRERVVDLSTGEAVVRTNASAGGASGQTPGGPPGRLVQRP